MRPPERLLPFLLLLAGCGGSDSGAGPDPVAETPVAESPEVVTPGLEAPGAESVPVESPGSVPYAPVTARSLPTAVQLPRERTEAVDLGEGEVSFAEETFRGSEKLKSRRQVLRVKDGIVNHGSFERWHPNGVVAEEGRFDHGKRIGTWIERFDTGQMLGESEYVDGELHGPKREWSDIGYLKKETWFEHGLRHGPYTVWDMRFEGQRILKVKGAHERDQKVGEWEVYYRSGKLREKGRYAADLKVGKWSSWHLSGNLMQEAEYDAGEWHGRVADFDELGNPRTEAIYEAGRLNGPLIEFYPEGPVKSEKLYVEGRANGQARSFYLSGQLESEGELVDGERQGHWSYWREDGSLNEGWTGNYVDGVRADDGAE